MVFYFVVNIYILMVMARKLNRICMLLLCIFRVLMIVTNIEAWKSSWRNFQLFSLTS